MTLQIGKSKIEKGKSEERRVKSEELHCEKVKNEE